MYLDASLSMASHDQQMPDARKLLLAQQQGLLPPGNVDATLWQEAVRLGSIRRTVKGSFQSDSIDMELLNRQRETLVRESKEIVESLDGFDWTSLGESSAGDPPWQDLASRLRSELYEPAQTLVAKPVDQVGARQAVAAELLDLAESTRVSKASCWQPLNTMGSCCSLRVIRPLRPPCPKSTTRSAGNGQKTVFSIPNEACYIG